MKNTVKLISITIFVLSILALTLASCDIDISDIFGEQTCDHQWGEWETIRESNCKTPGMMQRECEKCKETEEEATPLNDHAEGEWTIDEKASCTKDGIKSKKCEICGEVLRQEKIPLNGTHEYENHNCIYCGLTSEECFEFTYLPESDSYEIKANINYPLPSQTSLPSSFNGKKVTSIATQAFIHRYELTSVVIPDGITSINEGAFYFCNHLKSIVISDSVELIGNLVLDNCYNLTSISVGENNKSYKSIDGNLYSKDGKTLIKYAAGKKDTSFEMPDSVTTISDFALAYCENLESIVISDGAEFIGKMAFYHCEGLKSIVIPDNVTTIGESAFENCTSLASAVIGDGVSHIGDRVFYNCVSLDGIVIPDSVSYIGKRAFNECLSMTCITVSESNKSYKSIDGNLYSKDGKNLIRYACGKKDTSFEVPRGVTSIDDRSFTGSQNLQSIVIGDDVSYVGDWAFAGCNNITSIVIGDNVNFIGFYAFSHCSSLTDIYYKGNAEEWNNISIDIYGNDCLKSATLYYYCAEEPTEEGNFWHWVDGAVAIWE